MITKEEFLKKYNISRNLFEGSEMSWEDCCKIYDDFREKIEGHGQKGFQETG